jgi:hypothetical protein
MFGTAGGGYLDQGHLFDFTPTGSAWITAGAVGPQGGVFAYFAMLGALILLITATPETVADREADASTAPLII